MWPRLSRHREMRNHVLVDNAETTHLNQPETAPGAVVGERAPVNPDALERDKYGRSRLHPRVTSFRTRSGTLTDGQMRTWEETWGTIGRDVSDELIDAQEWFGRVAPLILEIGAGTGTSTAAMAKLEPECDVISVEVYKPGLAQLLHCPTALPKPPALRCLQPPCSCSSGWWALSKWPPRHEKLPGKQTRNRRRSLNTSHPGCAQSAVPPWRVRSRWPAWCHSRHAPESPPTHAWSACPS